MPAAARPAQAHSHPHAGGQAGSKPKLYNPRHPECSLLYQTIAEYFKTWLKLASAGQFDRQGDQRLRCFMQRDGAALNRLPRIFLRSIQMLMELAGLAQKRAILHGSRAAPRCDTWPPHVVEMPIPQRWMVNGWCSSLMRRGCPVPGATIRWSCAFPCTS